MALGSLGTGSLGTGTLGTGTLGTGALAEPPRVEIWRFDNTSRIGGHELTVLGRPEVIDTSEGKAVLFNGIDDALFFGVHPLAGASAFTWEVVFRPDAGGNAEQRFFHLQEDGSDNRMLFEIRLIGDFWCLDSFLKSGDASLALLDRTKLYPLGKWYTVKAVYDGRVFRNYVDGELQDSGELHAAPQKAGQSSVGVRFNRKDYFKGAIREARMTPYAQ
jgi:hypothetical protein